MNLDMMERIRVAERKVTRRGKSLGPRGTEMELLFHSDSMVIGIDGDNNEI